MKPSDVLDVYSWLLPAGESWVFTPGNAERARRILSAAVDDASARILTRELLEPLAMSARPLEHSQALLVCAVSEARRGDLYRGRELVDEAMRQREKAGLPDGFNKVLHQMLDWLFRESANPNGTWNMRSGRVDSLAAWSKQVIETQARIQESSKLRNIDVVYGWLFRDKRPGNLRPDVQAIQQQVETMSLEPLVDLQQDAQNRLKMIARLAVAAGAGKDLMERGEGLLECGRAAARLGLLANAREYFQRALLEYVPRTHSHAVTLWLLGIVTWEFPGEGSEASRLWMEAIESFRELGENDVKLDNRQWYRRTVEIMEMTLQDMARSVF